MVSIHEDPVVIHEVAVFVDKFMIAYMVMEVMIQVSRPVRWVKDRLCSPASVPCPPVRIPLTVAEDETIQHVHPLSIPVDCRPEVGKSYDLFNQPPDEEEHCNDNDKQPVHFCFWNSE